MKGIRFKKPVGCLAYVYGGIWALFKQKENFIDRHKFGAVGSLRSGINSTAEERIFPLITSVSGWEVTTIENHTGT